MAMSPREAMIYFVCPMYKMASRTDGRITDPMQKSSWWALTLWENFDKLKNIDAYPSWLKAVYGGEEKCPETGKIHFQGALNTQHIRWSQVRNWIDSKCDLQRCFSKPENLIKYVMKEETAVGEKVKNSNPRTFLEFHDLCEHIAYYGVPASYRVKVMEQFETNTTVPDITEVMFWNGVNAIIFIRPDLAGSLSKFNVKFWLQTAHTWLLRVSETRWSPRLVLPEEPDEERSVESPGPGSPHSVESLISHE